MGSALAQHKDQLILNSTQLSNPNHPTIKNVIIFIEIKDQILKDPKRGKKKEVIVN